ncbi:phage tail-collar fiber domain-containing protein [Photobacterium damselae]|uniref:phage tail-collar fiber domain-containing protein n=1 Tax=Photobacterium damselae TaxID=38293 RepID=UPI002F3FFEE9
MSKTILTSAFATYKAQCEANNKPIIMDEFVFALVPDQDPESDINPGEVLPPDSQIQGRFAVTQKGFINPDAVVYSIIIGTDIGTWDYNWIGLVNRDTNIVGAITHLKTQTKVKSDRFNNVEGDSIVRNVITPYTNASQLTQINVAADVWQLDFNSRLIAMDERVRTENTTMYGKSSFIANGWNVTEAGIEPGVGYVHGLECINRQLIPLSQNDLVLPKKVFLVASFEGSVNSEWQTITKIVIADSHPDISIENGVTFYSSVLAELQTSGIVDLRTPDWRTHHLNENEDPHPQYRTLATDKIPGISQFATKGESTNKDINDKMISPSSLGFVLDKFGEATAIPKATTEEYGKTRLATKEAVDSNDKSNDVVTVATLDKPGLKKEVIEHIQGGSGDNNITIKSLLGIMRKMEGKLGRVRIYMDNEIDDDYIAISGQTIFKTDYPEYFKHMGIADSTMTLPDWGEYGYIRQFNDTHVAGTQLADEIKRHNHTGSTSEAGGHTPIANPIDLGTKKGSFSEQLTIRRNQTNSRTPITLKGRSGDDGSQVVSPAWCFDAIDLGSTATHYIDVTIPSWTISQPFSSNNVSVPIGSFTPTMQRVNSHVHPVTVNYTGAGETRPKTTVAVYAVKVKYLTPMVE